MRRYPHQLSGGMNQRVVIAMALAKDPTLLILDEPTTGLDATVESEVLDLVAALREEFRSSVLFISHNLDVIARMCDRVGVLYAGRVVEEGPVDEVFDNPRHPYTVGLLRCIPRGGATQGEGRSSTRSPASCPGSARSCRAACSPTAARWRRTSASRRSPTSSSSATDTPAAATSTSRRRSCRAPRAPRRSRPSRSDGDRTPILRTENVRKTFHQDGHDVRAVEDLTFALGAGRDARARRRVRQREDDARPAPARADRSPTRARSSSSTASRSRARSASATASRSRDVQIVFQNPDSALNRRFSIQRIIGRALTKLMRRRAARRWSRACASSPTPCASTCG